MEDRELQKLLLDIQPQWHYWIAKPFKQMFDEGVSVGMYYCIQMLRQHGDSMTMTELARSVHCSKQQMTRTVSRLIDCRLAERISDPSDRRIIRLRLTEEGIAYTERFLANAEAYYRPILDSVTPEEKEALLQALRTLYRIFLRLYAEKGAAPRPDEE